MRKVRALLVEDSEDDALLVLRQLRADGIEPVSERVMTAAAMAELLGRTPWDVVIVDYQLPEFSAPEALDLVVELGLDIPFIVVSGSIGEEQAVAIMRAGARDYIMKDKLGRLGGAVLREVDAARSRAAQRVADQTLAHLARHDRLTGLANRTSFEDSLRSGVVAAARGGRTLAVIHVAILQLEDIVNTLGHKYGDLVVQEAAARAAKVVSSGHVVARLADDELGVMVDGGDAESGLRLAAELSHVFDEPVFVEDLILQVEVAAGVSLFPKHGTTAAALLRAAAVATRAARLGGGHALYSSERDPYSPRSLALLGALRGALESSQFFLHYQPFVDLRTGRAAGAEVLARWRHPDFGLVPPDQFIPLAEKSGLIRPLTRWAIDESLGRARAWRREGADLPIAVNLSARNLSDPDLVDRVERLLHAWGAPRGGLELEITESVIMSDPGRAQDVLERLRALGVKLSIDDFGTGYSSFGYLQRLPVSKIKIDKSFVLGLPAHDRNRAIVKAIIELGHGLGLEVVAEGVEDQATWEALRDLGCDMGQGFLMARPMSEPDLRSWFQASPYGIRPAPRPSASAR